MKRLILLALVAGLPARFLLAQSCSACSAPSFPDTTVSAQVLSTADSGVTPAWTGAGRFSVIVSPSNSAALPAALPAGTYPAWCGSGPRDAVSSKALYVATTTPPMGADGWNRVNYILNHKAGTVTEVQEAIWAVLGTMAISDLNAAAQLNAIAMYEDAMAHGSTFVPAPGDRTGIVLRYPYATGYQPLILEVAQCGSLGDLVWQDTNANGKSDTGERGLNGVRVDLLDSAGAVVATALTAPAPANDPWAAAGAGGWYRFTGICPGSYRVRVDPSQPVLGGAAASTSSSLDVDFAGTPLRNAAFGFTAGAPPLSVLCPRDWVRRGARYSSAVGISGASAPYTVAYTGTLPPGLAMDASGVISGQASATAAPGAYSFQAIVSAAGAAPVSAACVISIVPSVSAGCLADNPQLGKPYSGSLPVSGGSGQYAVGVTTPDLFPPGLSVDRSTGRVTGVPSSTGAYAFTAAVADRAGLADGPRSADCSLNVDPPPPPLGVGAVTARILKNVPYDSTVPVTGGKAPYRLSVVGVLPPGLTLDPSTGRLSGIPTIEGDFPFTVQAQDSAGAVATAGSDLIVDRPFTISCPGPVGYAALAYASPIGIAGGVGPFSFSATGLPAGLSLQGATVAGAPSVPGSSAVSLRVADAATGAWDSASCRIDIYSQPSVACPASAGLPGVAYSSSLTASGGAGRYAFTAAGLPAGWMLDSRSGLLSAAAPTPAVVTFTATVTDDAGGATASAQSACSIRIAAPMAVACPSAAGQAGVLYSSTVSATGGIAPYSYSIASGPLPAGLTMSAAGAVTGTPSASGTFPLTFAAADSTGRSETVACTLSIAPAAPSVACPAASAQVSVAYSSAIVASGGAPPYRYSLASGSLPSGLSLDPATGAISGVPTTVSVASWVAQVVDSRGTAAGTGTASCAIQTLPAPLTLAAPAPTAQAQVSYSSALVAAGGVGPYTFSIVSGALPAGLTLNPATGAVSGVPTTAKTYLFSAKVSDSSGKTAQIDAQIIVSAPPDSCGLTWGYWKTHESSWPAATLVLGAQTYTRAELSTLLDTAVKGDASLELAHQLIAAKLNVLNGTNPATAGGAIAQADVLLSAYKGKLPYSVKAGGPMTVTASALDYFNSDGAAQPGCVLRK